MVEDATYLSTLGEWFVISFGKVVVSLPDMTRNLFEEPQIVALPFLAMLRSNSRGTKKKQCAAHANSEWR